MDELLAKALEQPAGPDRDRWLDVNCNDDPDLERRLRALIEAHEAAGDFLEDPLVIIPPGRNAAPDADRLV